MTETPAPDAAVQIVWKTLADFLGPDRYRAEQSVAALARAGWLHDPRRVKALETVRAAAARFVYGPPGPQAQARYEALQRALDAAPAGQAAAEGIDCDRCVPGMHGERVDVHTFDQQPCEHVAR